MDVGAEVAAWMAALGAAAALLNQAYQAFKKRSKEKDEVEEALDRQPIIRQQLELGNVGEAVSHLNVIINSQAKHITAQDSRLASCDTELKHLSERNDALEMEASGWERRYTELEASVDRKLQEIKDHYEGVIKNLERTYARSLSNMRDQVRELKKDE